MNRIFPGKTAVYVSYYYSREHACQVSAKSLERLSGKSGNGLTNQRTNQPAITTLTSTNVENCNAGDLHALR